MEFLQKNQKKIRSIRNLEQIHGTFSDFML